MGVLGSLYDACYNAALSLVELNVVPDFIVRAGIRMLLQKRIALETRGDNEQQLVRYMAFVADLRGRAVAEQAAAANEQHYEVPTAFYQLVLGPRLKYSSCYYPPGVPQEDLRRAEDAMLELTCARARLANGLDILELGCGWGSLSLFMAEKYPGARITAVSNSSTQREHIERECRAKGITNLEVITADMNTFDPVSSSGGKPRFDRVVSVEMFEHMKNYEELLRRVATWLRPRGTLFVHIFAHRDFHYHFEVLTADDWMAKYFFTGGTMPSEALLLHYQRDLQIQDRWRVNGTHYSKTLEAWLVRFDAKRRATLPILESTYGARHRTRWLVYWRLFFLACSELFALNGGNDYFVAHYLFQKPEPRPLT